MCEYCWNRPPTSSRLQGCYIHLEVPPSPIINQIAGWQWSLSNTSWSTETLAYKWITHVFEPLTATPTANRRLLIVDGHGSQVKAPFIAICIAHSIDLMILPSHLLQKTQPSDVGIFGPLKYHLARETDRYALGRATKGNWAANMVQAQALAMTETNILASWKSTGLHPFNSTRLIPVVKIPSTPTSQTP